MKRCFSFKNQKPKNKILTDKQKIEKIKKELHVIEYTPISNPESLDKVYRLFVKIIVGETINAIEHYYYGIYFYQEKRFEMAKEYFKMALDMKYTDAIVFLSKLEKNRTEKIKLLLKGIESKNYNCAFELGKLCEKTGQYGKMEKLYALCMRKNVQAGNAQFRLGYFYEREKDYAKMEKYYLMSIINKNVDAMNRLGWHYHKRTKNKSFAEMYYLMAIELNNDPNALFSLAQFYEEMGDTDKMIVYLERGTQQNHILSLNKLAQLYKERNNYNKMKEYLQKAIDQNSTEAIVSMALYHKENNDYANMIELLDKAVKKNDYAASKIYIAYHQEQIEKCYENALKSNDTTQCLYSMADYIEYLFQNKKPNKVHDLCNDNDIFQNKNDKYSIKKIGNYLEKNGKIDTMIAFYLLTSEKDPTSYFYLGKYYESISDFENMAKYYSLAKQKEVKKAVHALEYYGDLFTN